MQTCHYCPQCNSVVNVSFTSAAAPISATARTVTTATSANVQQRDNCNNNSSSLSERRLCTIFDDDIGSNIVDQGYLKINKLLKLCIYTTLLIIFSIFGLLALDITLSIETLDDSVVSRRNHSIGYHNDTGADN